MTEETRSFWRKAVIALLIRPPLILIVVLLGLVVWGGQHSDAITVDERFALSSSIKSPYRDTLKGAYQYSFAFCADPHIGAEGDGCFPDLDSSIRANRISFVVLKFSKLDLGQQREHII